MIDMPIIAQWKSDGVLTGYTFTAPTVPSGRIVKVYVDGLSVPIRWTSAGSFTFSAVPRAGAIVTVGLALIEQGDFIVHANNLDFPSIAAGGVQDLTMTGNAQLLTTWSVHVTFTTATPAGVILSAWVSAAGTVTVRAYNPTAGAIDPVSAAVRVTVFPA